MGRIPWNKKSNIYDLSGEYGVGWTSNTNEEFYFDLEDYDKEDGSSIFNCGSSALWTNYAKVFKKDLSEMYSNLRSNEKFSYEYINQKMRTHQNTWPKAIWNEDEYGKYIGSLIDKGADHLSKL